MESTRDDMIGLRFSQLNREQSAALDNREREHLAAKPWMTVGQCTCRIGSGEKSSFSYYICKRPHCMENGSACGGYCRGCFDEHSAWVRESMEMIKTPLRFDEVAEINRRRSLRWHAKGEPWSGADWSNAMGGEAGELGEAVETLVLGLATVSSATKAGNVVKKLRRGETGTGGAVDPDREQLIEELGDELADVLLYGFLLADHYGISVAEAVIRKFNFISDREGLPERLPFSNPTNRPAIPDYDAPGADG